jgi:hypothetical protein
MTLLMKDRSTHLILHRGAAEVEVTETGAVMIPRATTAMATEREESAGIAIATPTMRRSRRSITIILVVQHLDEER